MNAHQQFPLITDKPVGGHLFKTVDGREVHRFLGARKDYSNWIKDRIAKFGFIENVDYAVFTNFGENPAGGRPATEYFLTIGMGKELGMVDRTERGRAIRKYFLSIEEGAQLVQRPMTTTETLIQMLTIQADVERRQAEQQVVIEAMDARVAMIEDTAPLKVKPQSTETKSEIKIRMNKLYGLPAWLIDEVLTSISYRPPVFAMVKNSHESAQGSSFAVYQIIDVTKLFKRFVSECRPATPTTSTHPDIDRRFQLIRKGDAS